MQRLFLAVALVAFLPVVPQAVAQSHGRALNQRQVPCQTQYAQAVQTIGMARWSAPEAERPAIERLLNAASKAKELIDASFLQWDDSLCSTETIGRLRSSVDRLQANGWLPVTPEQRREAEAAAVNEELLKALGTETGQSATASRPVAVSSERRALTAE
jgi:hypothetical protein